VGRLGCRQLKEPSSGWGREFEEPIALPDGRKLILLRDAASYITTLPAQSPFFRSLKRGVLPEGSGQKTAPEVGWGGQPKQVFFRPFWGFWGSGRKQ
jgi:hypothetical protein